MISSFYGRVYIFEWKPSDIGLFKTNGIFFFVFSESLLNFESPNDYFGLRLLFDIELLPVVD